MRVYLDWNATTPPVAEVLDAMRDAASRAWANPASVHAHGRAARASVEDARAAVALLGGVDARDVVLTSGGTEANNLAIRSVFADGASGRVLVTSRLEHPSVTRVAEALEREGHARVRWLAVRPDGVIDLDDLGRILAEEAGQVALLALQVVNHETGVLQPVREAASTARAAGARVHVDAVQAWGRLPRDVSHDALDPLFGGDTASLAAHKMRGPKGIGALLTRPSTRLAPVLLGGAQEKGIRPGTVDPIAAAGLGAAAARAGESPRRWSAVAALRDTFEASLVQLGASVVGRAVARAPHVTNVSFPGWSGAELVAALDLEGVSVSSGAACSAGTVEPSPVIRAILGDARASAAVRLSLGEETSLDDVARATAAFARVLARVMKGHPGAGAG